MAQSCYIVSELRGGRVIDTDPRQSAGVRRYCWSGPDDKTDRASSFPSMLL